MNSNTLTVQRNGVIYLPVTSDGTSGEEWIKRLENNGCKLPDITKDILRSESFKPTKGVDYQIAILSGQIFKDQDRVNSLIRRKAYNLGLSEPPLEVGCLFREKCSPGIRELISSNWVIVMHDPVKIECVDKLLTLNLEFDQGRAYFSADYGFPSRHWRDDDNAFLFIK